MGSSFKKWVFSRVTMNQYPVPVTGPSPLRQLSYLPARRTAPVMHIDRPPAGMAGPAFPLALYKPADSVFADRFEVLKHTHVVLRPVPLVQLPEPPAGKTVAGVAVPALHLRAGSDGAVTVAPAIGRIAAFTPVLRSEKRGTNSTVHAARRDQHGPEWCPLRHMSGSASGLIKPVGWICRAAGEYPRLTVPAHP
jgi:hypothetical protein